MPTNIKCDFNNCKFNVKGECTKEEIELTEVYISNEGTVFSPELYLNCEQLEE